MFDFSSLNLMRELETDFILFLIQFFSQPLKEYVLKREDI